MFKSKTKLNTDFWHWRHELATRLPFCWSIACKDNMVCVQPQEGCPNYSLNNNTVEIGLLYWWWRQVNLVSTHFHFKTLVTIDEILVFDNYQRCPVSSAYKLKMSIFCNIYLYIYFILSRRVILLFCFEMIGKKIEHEP